MDKAALESLLARVDKATGPDRDLDRAILDALGVVVREFDPGDGDVSQWREWSDGTKVANTHITVSKDAAFALAEQMLPGWGFQVGRPTQKYVASGWYASVFPGDGVFYHDYDTGPGNRIRLPDTYRPNGSLAILAALLRALIARAK